MQKTKINSVLISVFNKEGIDDFCKEFYKNNIEIYSTGGTKKHIEKLNISVKSIESITGYPSILGGRVKTLHPKIYGSLLSRSDNNEDKHDQKKYDIPKIDMLIVDLYPFKETVLTSKDENKIIEKIDIGGVSLIRAAAKNYSEVLVVSSKKQYKIIQDELINNNFSTNKEFKKKNAYEAFKLVADYDNEIKEYFEKNNNYSKQLRYGENPHQKATFTGEIKEIFEKIHGKELSYNNLLDVDSALKLISEFDETTFAIINHNNACGIASSFDVHSSYKLALEADPISAFGGVLVANKTIDETASKAINKLFFEIIIAPKYTSKALKLLKSKKNRIILIQKKQITNRRSIRTILNGTLQQDMDTIQNNRKNWKLVTETRASLFELEDLEFANKIVKYSKSNAIVLVKNKQMVSSGVGQTSRIDALNFAINKAKRIGLDTNNSVMASDAFFPFPDCVQIAFKAGINSIVQPGGSIKDDLSIIACNENKISMFFSGIRHFYH